MEPCSSLQSTWEFFSKKSSIACLLKLMKIPTRAKVWASCKTLCLCSLSLFWALSNSMTRVRNFSYSHDQDHVHVRSHAMLLHWKIASISIHHKIKLQVIPWPTLSPKLPLGMWAIQKEIKNTYPKKLCHMLTRACYKKKMHIQRRYATCSRGMSKKREKIAHIQEK